MTEEWVFFRTSSLLFLKSYDHLKWIGI